MSAADQLDVLVVPAGLNTVRVYVYGTGPRVARDVLAEYCGRHPHLRTYALDHPAPEAPTGNPVTSEYSDQDHKYDARVQAFIRNDHARRTGDRNKP